MKKAIALSLCLIVLLTILAGCGNKGRELYNVNLKKYVTLGEYKGIEVDTSSKDYKYIYEFFLNSDRNKNNMLVKDGTAKIGDITYIDYVGKKDGVAFDGGTASGYNLELGSGKFIPGFEEAIVGHKLGTSFTINVTFPEDYGSTDLAGQAVTFDINLHGVLAQVDDVFAKKMGFPTLDDYRLDVKNRAIGYYCLNEIASNSTIVKYPKKDLNKFYNEYKESINQQLISEGSSFEAYLSTNNISESEIKEYYYEQKKPSMDTEMLLYAIIDKEKIKITKDDREEALKKMAKEQGVTVEKLREETDDIMIETNVVYDKALAVLADNAIVK